jgi:hypothetical protein
LKIVKVVIAYLKFGGRIRQKESERDVLESSQLRVGRTIVDEEQNLSLLLTKFAIPFLQPVLEEFT